MKEGKFIDPPMLKRQRKYRQSKKDNKMAEQSLKIRE